VADGAAGWAALRLSVVVVLCDAADAGKSDSSAAWAVLGSLCRLAAEGNDREIVNSEA
jgi:hypothetical protein